jgi:hypothetical protein
MYEKEILELEIWIKKNQMETGRSGYRDLLILQQRGILK